MKFFVLFSCLILVVFGANDPCDYVANTRLMTNPVAVRECFNSHRMEPGAVDTLLKLMETSKDIYVYKDLFKNPPVYDGSPVTKLDYDSEVDKAKEEILKSGNISSKVFRAFQTFASKFEDYHLSSFFSSTEASKYIFDTVYAFFPFAWTSEKGPNGEPIIKACASADTPYIDPDLGKTLNALYQQGEYIKTVDGQDAFTFFSNYLGKYNNMKSSQAKLFVSYWYSLEGTKLTDYPLDDEMFNEHTMVYSNGQEVKMNITCVNRGLQNTKYGWDKKVPTQQEEALLSMEKEAEVLKNFKFNPHQKKVGATGYVFCQPSTTINYFHITSFPADTTLLNQVLMEIIQCFGQFDQNSAPIVVDVEKNPGGHTLVGNAIQYLLMPNRALAGVSAVRKTPINKAIGINGGMILDQRIMCPGCKTIDRTTAEAWWNPSFVDDYGNGVKHERTDKGTISFPESLSQLSGYVMKNVRNPTDIIILTDGYCYSACSYFAHSISETGGAIFAGIGPYNPKSDLFPHSQCPSKFIGVGSYVPELLPYIQKYGVDMRVTYAESYPFPVKPTDLYPRDFVPTLIDANLHTFSLTASLNDILLAALKVTKEYKTTCNPNNKNLVFVNNECKVDDPNALDVGYACGDDGKWDTTKCVISTCKPGYAVDFEKNECVNYYCDPRTFK